MKQNTDELMWLMQRRIIFSTLIHSPRNEKNDFMLSSCRRRCCWWKINKTKCSVIWKELLLINQIFAFIPRSSSLLHLSLASTLFSPLWKQSLQSLHNEEKNTRVEDPDPLAIEQFLTIKTIWSDLRKSFDSNERMNKWKMEEIQMIFHFFSRLYRSCQQICLLTLSVFYHHTFHGSN
jgi:hypothetical protein